MSSASKSITVVSMAIGLTVGVIVFRTVTGEQLQAMQQCTPQCQLGAPLFGGPWEFVAPALLLLTVVLAATSMVAGWPIASAQMRP